MKNKMDMETLLRQALSPTEEPDEQLNRKILRKAKETDEMSRKYFKSIPATAMIAAAVLFVGSVTTVAAWRYLTPEKVAEVLEDEGLMAAFKGENAVLINESQECGEYKVTLLGIVSGKNLTQYLMEDESGDVKADRTYVVTAIENADGTPRPAGSDGDYGEETFFVSPLIQGLDPNWYNSVTMNGGYSEVVENGVQYRITELDNVEIFADRSLYLAVNSGVFYDSQAYQFDEKSGEISRNEEYEGVNALFSLPVDASKADREAADAYVQKVEQELFGDGEEDSQDEAERSGSVEEGDGDSTLEDGAKDAVDLAAELVSGDWTEESLKEHATLLEGLTQVLQPDENGEYLYSYEIEEDGMSSSGRLFLEELFPDGQAGLSEVTSITGSGEEGGIYIETYTLNEDGTITLKVYRYQG